MNPIVLLEQIMRKPINSPSMRSGLERIDGLAVNTADRAIAREEFERAEAFADTLTALVRNFRMAVSGSTGAFETRRERLE